MQDSEAQNPNSYSEIEIPKLTYETKGDERLLTTVLKKVQEMEKELHDLKVKKILDETNLPPEMLEQNGLLPSPPSKRQTRRGRGYRPLLRSEIEEAKRHSIFGAKQAAYLGVGILTYKKYAKLHGLWEPAPWGKGKRRRANPNGGKYSLEKILNGEFNNHPNVDDWKVKRKLFRAGTFPLCCSVCGYDKKRLGDEFPLLLLDHMDGNKKNFNKDNLRFLCWNCTAECGRGYLTRGFRSFDPDWNPQ